MIHIVFQSLIGAKADFCQSGIYDDRDRPPFQKQVGCFSGSLERGTIADVKRNICIFVPGFSGHLATFLIQRDIYTSLKLSPGIPVGSSVSHNIKHVIFSFCRPFTGILQAYRFLIISM
jgi:hypothetical protein